MTLVLILALIIGILLGLLGGGGSVLTVPVMVYVVGLDPKTAIATSLVVVGTTSMVAIIGHARAGRVCWKTGLVFGLAGMVGAFAGGRLAAYIPGNILLILFAVVLLVTALAMLQGRKEENPGASGGPICPAHINFAAVLFDGLMVGALNGLVGVGGGFVIVPALNLLGGLPMHAAVGTSLLIITMNSMAALAGYISHVHIDPWLVATVTAMAIVGSLLGGLLSRRLRGVWLRRSFGLFVLGMAAYLFHRELNWQVVDELKTLFQQHREFFVGLASASLIVLLNRFRSYLHDRFPAKNVKADPNSQAQKKTLKSNPVTEKAGTLR